MKTCIRIGWLVLALGLAGLVTGCVSQSSSYRRQPANDFEVVETSTKRELTTREMAYLRAKVADYLVQQGETGSGDYYVKIYLGEDEGVQKGDWVVVRFTRYPSTQFSQLASYPTTTYPSYPHYNYDYLPLGWFGFSALSFRYYEDPYYYGYNGYYPRWYHPRYTGNWRDHDRKHDHRRDRDRDRNHDRDRPRHDYNDRPSGALKPSFVPSHTDRTRWSNRDHDNRPSFNGRRRENRENRDNRDPSQPRNENRPHWRDRQANNPNLTGTPAPTNSFTPASPPASSVAAPPARPATRSDFHRQRNTSETGRIARPHTSTGEGRPGGRERSYTPSAPSTPSPSQETRSHEAPRPQPQPAYNPPAPRSEPASDSGQRTNVNDGGRRAREP